MKIKAVRGVLRLLCLCLCLSGCSGGGGEASPPNADTGKPASSGTATSKPKAEPAGPYIAPEPKTAQFKEENAVESSGVKLDLSSVNEGYIAVKATNPNRMKFKVKMGKEEYAYDLPNTGEVTIYPLQCGSGDYTFHAFQNTSGSSYLEIMTEAKTVNLESEMAPFLRPNQQVNYNENSACVQLAKEFAQTAGDEVGMVSAVYQYVADNIKYDYDFANAPPPKGYISDPDRTLSSKKGICGDYSSLVAAMLRSQGIPTKMITGYVSPEDLYHAWNMIYLSGTGWITVEIKASSKEWQRIDLTFAANGEDSSFIGDGSNYVDRYVY